MASGDLLCEFFPQNAYGPTSNYPQKVYTAAPKPVLAYDDSTTETAYFDCYMPGQYDGSSDIKVVLPWCFATFVGSQTCDWEVSFYRLAEDVDSIKTFTFAAAQATLSTEASADAEPKYASITFTNAQADGVQPEEWFVLRVVRDATGGTASPGDAWLSAGAVVLA